MQGVLKGYKSVRNIRQGRAWERPCQRLWKPRDHLRVTWGTELSIHLDGSSSKGEPLGDHPSLGRKERQDCGSHRLGLWSQIQARPTGGGVESEDPGRNKTPAGMGPGQLVISKCVRVCDARACVCTCARGSELQSHCFEPTKPPPERERQLFFFSCVKKKKIVPVPPSPPLRQNGELVAEKGGRTVQDPPQVCAGHNHCLRHPRKVQLEGRQEKRLGQTKESQED